MVDNYSFYVMMDQNKCLKGQNIHWTLLFIVIYAGNYNSYGVIIKSYGMTGRHEVSYHMMFSALSTTLSLVATH